MMYLKNERIWDMEITEGGSGPSGCVQHRGLTRAGARAAKGRAARTATGVTGTNSSVVFFLWFCFFTMGHTPIHWNIHPYTGAYTAYRTMFQKGESTRLAWFLGGRGCSGQITFHTSVYPVIGQYENYTPEHKKLYVDACDTLPY